MARWFSGLPTPNASTQSCSAGVEVRPFLPVFRWCQVFIVFCFFVALSCDRADPRLRKTMFIVYKHPLIRKRVSGFLVGETWSAAIHLLRLQYLFCFIWTPFAFTVVSAVFTRMASSFSFLSFFL